MRKSIIILSVLAAGCVPTKTLKLSVNNSPTITGASCEGSAASRCTFINSPVKLGKKKIILPGRVFPFFLTEQKLKFIDAAHRQWEAPVNTLTDGASIPPPLVAIVGNPRAKEFINAATIHDAYCATGNEEKSSYHTAPWQLVHRMFYDALLVGGTLPLKAKVMYAGVYLGGPRWEKVKGPLKKDRSITAGTRSQQSNIALTARGVPIPKLVFAMKQAKAFIQANNPSINQLESYLTGLEKSLLGIKPGRKTKSTTREVEGGDGGEGEGG